MGTLPTEDQILAVLEKVKDPELGVSIVDLGLVYGIQVAGSAIEISMTMTSAGCPLADVLEAEAREALQEAFPQMSSVQVGIVWEPQWSPMMMSWRAKQQLGWAN